MHAIDQAVSAIRQRFGEERRELNDRGLIRLRIWLLSEKPWIARYVHESPVVLCKQPGKTPLGRPQRHCVDLSVHP